MAAIGMSDGLLQNRLSKHKNHSASNKYIWSSYYLPDTVWGVSNTIGEQQQRSLGILEKVIDSACWREKPESTNSSSQGVLGVLLRQDVLRGCLDLPENQGR